MEISEMKYFEALGVEPLAPDTDDIGVKEEALGQHVVDAAVAESQQEEPVKPLEIDVVETNTEDADTEPETDESAQKPPVQSPEERREQAAQRRRREQQEAIEQAVAAEREKSRAEMEAFFKNAGLKNTITGEPIRDMDQFNAWKSAYDAAKLERDLQAGKLTPESLNQVISENPVIRQAQDMIRRNEEEAKRANMEAMKAQVDAQIREIQKLDPSIREVGDLLKMPNAREFYEYVRRGNNFLDAYYLVNRERLKTAAITAAQAAARQQAISNARSKDHLSATAVRGGGAISVPSDELALFREFMPNAKEADIQAYYQKYKNQ